MADSEYGHAVKRLSYDGEMLTYPLTSDLKDQLDSLPTEDKETLALLQALLLQAHRYLSALDLIPKYRNRRNIAVALTLILPFVFIAPFMGSSDEESWLFLLALIPMVMNGVFWYRRAEKHDKLLYAQLDIESEAESDIPGFSGLLKITTDKKETPLSVFAHQLLAWETEQAQMAKENLEENQRALTNAAEIKRLKEKAIRQLSQKEEPNHLSSNTHTE